MEPSNGSAGYTKSVEINSGIKLEEVGRFGVSPEGGIC